MFGITKNLYFPKWNPIFICFFCGLSKSWGIRFHKWPVHSQALLHPTSLKGKSRLILYYLLLYFVRLGPKSVFLNSAFFRAFWQIFYLYKHLLFQFILPEIHSDNWRVCLWPNRPCLHLTWLLRFIKYIPQSWDPPETINYSKSVHYTPTARLHPTQLLYWVYNSTTVYIHTET